MRRQPNDLPKEGSAFPRGRNEARLATCEPHNLTVSPRLELTAFDSCRTPYRTYRTYRTYTTGPDNRTHITGFYTGRRLIEL
jgi:hypothetical protein